MGEPEYELYQGEHGGTKRSEVTRDGLETLKEYRNVIGAKSTLETILAAAGYKYGALVTQAFPDDAAIDRFVETLNDMGVTCAVDRQDPAEGKEYTRVFVTRDESYTAQDFEEIQRRKETDEDTFHRELGDFLGYPEEDVETYVERGVTPPAELEEHEYRTGVVKEHGTTQDEPAIAWTQETKNSVFNSYVPSAEPEQLEEYERRSRTRFRAVEAIEQAYDVDLHDLTESYAESLSGTPWGEDR